MLHTSIQVIVLSSFVVLIHAYAYYSCTRCHKFPSKELQLSLSDVRRILIDEQNSRIIIAARDCVVRLNPSLSNEKASYEYINISAPEDIIQQCITSGNTRRECHNYMRLLVFDNNNKILACGTHATKPKCWTFHRTGAFSISSEMDGMTRSPSFPDQNVTGVVIDHPVKNGYLFTGINIGSSGTRYSAIYRKAVNVSLDGSFLKTVQSEDFLKDANFVSSYVAPDNFVYFFWREKARESQNMEIYSRVGRVCSYDAGTKIALKNRFTSFTKSRLLCSVPGGAAESFPYNYLQSTFKYAVESSSDIIYGIFTTPESGLIGSAVCSYSLNAIQSLFTTSQYMEEVQKPSGVSGRVWKSVSPPQNIQDPGRPMCNAGLSTLSYVRDTAKFAKEHPLLAETVKPTTGKPLLVMPNTRFTQLVVDKVKTVISGIIHQIPVMFLATDNGTIYKVVEGRFSSNKKARIVEQINVFKAPRPIQTLKLYKNSLYVGCTTAITKVLTQRCSDHTTCRSCVELKDPYCGWSTNKCTTKQVAASSSWVQDIIFGKFESVCPEDPPNCSIKMSVNNPGGTTVIECFVQGIPVPSVTQWYFSRRKITTGSDYTIKDLDYSQKLLVHNFGLRNLGEYQCTVQNTKGDTHHCKLQVKGTLPVVSSGFSKTSGQTHFWCNAKGFPKPSVVRYKIIKGLVSPVTTAINMDHGTRAYYCIAQNAFGPSIGTNFTIEERNLDVELKLAEEVWDKELQNLDSVKYKTLSLKLKHSVAYVYSNNTSFMDTTQVRFSKGSVVADIELRFASKPSETDANLLTDLQNAISSGKIGSIQVERTNILSKYMAVPTQGYRAQAQGVDRGIFVVAILVAIVLSVLVGFLLGIKFHRQALNSCGPKGHDSSIHEEKTIQSLKYTKSPTIDSAHNPSDEKQEQLLHNKDSSEDGDSIGSSGGRIHIIEPSKKPEHKVLVNGKIPKSC